MSSIRYSQLTEIISFQLTSSVYPWFHDTRSIVNVVIGTIDGFIDGAIVGLLLAWLYNTFVGVQTHA